MLVAVLWLAAPAILPAQQDTPTYSLHPPTPAGTCTLHGSVVDAVTKQPIARALVEIANDDAILTDSYGQFEFPNVPAGSTSVRVRRPGYISNAMGGGFAPSEDQQSEFEVNVGPDMQPLVFSIPPEAVITGQISLLDSDDPDGIQVTAYRKAAENGRPKWRMAGMATTNSEGIFRIASLSAGSYLLYAQPPGELYAGPDSAAESAYAAVYFPGVTDAGAAGVVKVATGERKQADIALVRQSLYPVTIKLANVPQANSSLDISDSDGLPVQSRMRYEQAQQTVHTELPAGRYIVSANTFDSGTNTQLVGRTEFTVTSAAVTYVGVTVLPLRSIPVTIRREFTATQKTAPEAQTFFVQFGSVQQTFANPGVSLSLVGADAFGQSAVGGLVPLSHDGSSYQIMNVPPGKYWTTADAGQDYISSITSGGVDLMQNTLTVGAGGASAPIEITLRNDAGSIDLTFGAGHPGSSGEALSLLFFYVVPLFPTIAGVQEMRVQPSEKFTINNLAPGPYRVVLSASQQQIEYRTPDGLAEWENKGQVVNVEPGGTAHVQLDWTSAEEQAQ